MNKPKKKVMMKHRRKRAKLKTKIRTMKAELKRSEHLKKTSPST